MCIYYGFTAVRVQDPDDMVANGFTVVIDVAPSPSSRFGTWW
jgi:hypothetical protein